MEPLLNFVCVCVGGWGELLWMGRLEEHSDLFLQRTLRKGVMFIKLFH